MTKRQQQLARARSAGYHRDRAGFARLVVERRGVAERYLRSAYAEGYEARERGERCSCPEVHNP